MYGLLVIKSHLKKHEEENCEPGSIGPPLYASSRALLGNNRDVIVLRKHILALATCARDFEIRHLDCAARTESCSISQCLRRNILARAA